MFLYIDPGTGSMLFSLAIGIATTLVFAFRALAVKLHFVFTGGKAAKITAKKIPFVIFSDHKRYWNVFRPICDEFENRKIPLVYYTQSADDPVFSQNYEFVKAEFIGEGNKGFVKMNMLNAGVVLATTPGLDVLQWKRSRNVDFYVHVLHSVDSPLRYRMFGLAHFDALLLNGSHQESYVRLCENAQNSPKKELAITGATFMDSLFERKLELPKIKNETPTVLLAPTWGKIGLLYLYGESLISALLKTPFKIIVRPHPQSTVSEKPLLQNLMQKFPQSENLEWNFENDNATALNRADIMISDLSGVIFDMALVFDKPFLYLNCEYDGSCYDSCWVSDPLWVMKVAPVLGREIKSEDFCDLEKIILDALKSEALAESRKKLRNEAWHFQGKGAEKTVDYLLQKWQDICVQKEEQKNPHKKSA